MKIKYNLIEAQKGRSMIEILAVLAIVAVLTVVGILGFSRGMDKYKTGKVLDQTSSIHQSLQELHGKMNTFKGLGNGDATSTTNTAVALDVFPEKMIQTIDGQRIVRHAGGGEVQVTTDGEHVTVTFYDLGKDAAISLATSDFEAKSITINSDSSAE